MKQLALEVHSEETYVSAGRSTRAHLAMYVRTMWSLQHVGFRQWRSQANQHGAFTSAFSGRPRTCCYNLYFLNLRFLRAPPSVLPEAQEVSASGSASASDIIWSHFWCLRRSNKLLYSLIFRQKLVLFFTRCVHSQVRIQTQICIPCWLICIPYTFSKDDLICITLLICMEMCICMCVVNQTVVYRTNYNTCC